VFGACVCVTVSAPHPEAKVSVTPVGETVVSRTVPNMESMNNVTESPCNPPTQAVAAGLVGVSVPVSVAVGAPSVERATLPVTLAAQGWEGAGETP
jgi:hypothetical protein